MIWFMFSNRPTNPNRRIQQSGVHAQVAVGYVPGL